MYYFTLRVQILSLFVTEKDSILKLEINEDKYFIDLESINEENVQENYYEFLTKEGDILIVKLLDKQTSKVLDKVPIPIEKLLINNVEGKVKITKILEQGYQIYTGTVLFKFEKKLFKVRSYSVPFHEAIKEMKKPPGKYMILLCEDGKYAGEVENNQRHGFGEILMKNGDSYYGEWKNDKFHGLGSYLSKDSTYYGDWKNGLQEGFGTIQYNDGSYFEGKFIKGTRNGNGKLIVPNGDQFIGEWKGDQFKGDYKKGNIQDAPKSSTIIWKEKIQDISDETLTFGSVYKENLTNKWVLYFSNKKVVEEIKLVEQKIKKEKFQDPLKFIDQLIR